MLATTTNSSTYGWLVRAYEAGEGFAAWVAWVCFLEWGVIHILAGVITIRPSLQDDVSSVCTGLMSGLPAGAKAAMNDQRQKKWPAYTSRITLQHGINLGWIGLWSISMCYFVHYPPRMLWLIGLPVYLFDWGYFIAIDTVHVGGCFGEVQTYVCSIGLLLCSVIAKNTYSGENIDPMHAITDAEFGITAFVPCFLMLCGIINKIMGCMNKRRGASSPPLNEDDQL